MSKTTIQLVNKENEVIYSGDTASPEKYSIMEWTLKIRAAYVRWVMGTLDPALHHLTVAAIKEEALKTAADSNLKFIK